MTRQHPSSHRRRQVLLAAVATTLGLWVVPLTATPAMACSCVEKPTDQAYARQADAVFVGRVDQVRTSGPFSTSSDPKTAVFASYGSDSLVEVAPEELRTSLCSGTRRADFAPVTLVAGYAPMAGGATTDSAGFPLLGWVSFVAVAGLGAMPVALWLRLRGRL